MRVELKGKFYNMQDVEKALDGAITPVFERIRQETQELFNAIEDGFMADVNLVFNFELEGQQEPTVLTVDHHGTPEMLVIKAEFDEEGNMLEQSDNEEVSEFTEVEALIAQGLPTEFAAIESRYYSDQLFELEEYQIKDMTVALFHTGDLSEESGVIVVQYQQDNKLIQEIEVPWREWEKLNLYFQELAE